MIDTLCKKCGFDTAVDGDYCAACDDGKRYAVSFNLREYQTRAVENTLQCFERADSALMVAATGTGKTVTFASLIERMVGEQRVLVVAHRDELITQAADKIHRVTGLDCDIEKGDFYADQCAFDLRAPVIVTSVQTMSRPRRMERFHPEEFNLLICDEAHHATSKTYRAVFEYFQINPQLKIFGCTATPDRADEAALGQIFKEVAFEYSMLDAIDDGWLVPVEQQFVQIEGLDLSEVRTTAGDLNQGDLAKIVEQEKNCLQTTSAILQIVPDTPTLVFAASVAQAELMCEIANRHAPGCAEWLCGDSVMFPIDRRRELLKGFRERKYDYLFNCLDSETEILTARGWIGKDDFEPNDLMASIPLLHRSHTRNAFGNIEWVRAEGFIKRQRHSNERMVHVSNQTIDIRVTEGHDMIVRAPGAIGWKKIKAGKLPLMIGPYELPLCGVGNARNDLSLTLDECRFIGLFITDGHHDKTGSRGITIGQSQGYVQNNKLIVDILDGCGFDWKKTASKTTKSRHLQNRYRIPRGNIKGSLARRGYNKLLWALDKHLSPSLLSLNREQTKALIEGIWLGDGNKETTRPPIRGRKSWRINNTDVVMLERLQILAVTRGFAANLFGPFDNGEKATKPLWILAIRDTNHVATNNHAVDTSGGNPARFEPVWIPEEVWCVKNKNGTIVTRRNGKVSVMGQCMVLTEGFDQDNIGCIAVARPTMSRALYTQMIGRGTRPIDGLVDGLADPIARRSAIATSDKASVLVLDFVGNSGRHKLINTGDILGGNFDDAIVAEATRAVQAKSSKNERADMLAELRAAEERRRLARLAAHAHIAPTAKYQTKSIDPFDIYDITPRREPGWFRGKKPTEKQLAFLDKAGIPTKELSFCQASQLIGETIQRRDKKLATFKQGRLLLKHGFESAVSFKEASEIIDRIAKSNWTLKGPLFKKG